jgi:hypothetical protein
MSNVFADGCQSVGHRTRTVGLKCGQSHPLPIVASNSPIGHTQTTELARFTPFLGDGVPAPSGASTEPSDYACVRPPRLYARPEGPRSVSLPGQRLEAS